MNESVLAAIGAAVVIGMGLWAIAFGAMSLWALWLEPIAYRCHLLSGQDFYDEAVFRRISRKRRLRIYGFSYGWTVIGVVRAESKRLEHEPAHPHG